VLVNGNNTGGTKIEVNVNDAGGGGIDLVDDAKIRFSTSGHMQIYGTGSENRIYNNGAPLRITMGSGGSVIIGKTDNSTKIAEFTPDGSADLYYDGTKTFETTSAGVQITGKGTSDLTVAADAAATLVTKSYVDASAPSGTFTGSKVFASGTLLELFKIKKATTGALIFDVYLSASLSGSSNKKYTVAHYLGSTPTYNKIIDSGFTAAGGDVVVSFINSTTTATGDSVTCNITSTNAQTVSYTVQAGFDSVNAVSIL